MLLSIQPLAFSCCLANLQLQCLVVADFSLDAYKHTIMVPLGNPQLPLELLDLMPHVCLQHRRVRELPCFSLRLRRLELCEILG